MLEQETGYPWNGDIRVKVAQGNLPFTMNIRIPGWVRGSVLPSDLYSYADDLKLGYRVLVNGEEVTGELRKGYLRIDRKWKKGDVVEVHFDMQPRVVKANEKWLPTVDGWPLSVVLSFIVPSGPIMILIYRISS